MTINYTDTAQHIAKVFYEDDLVEDYEMLPDDHGGTTIACLETLDGRYICLSTESDEDGEYYTFTSYADPDLVDEITTSGGPVEDAMEDLAALFEDTVE